MERMKEENRIAQRKRNHYVEILEYRNLKIMMVMIQVCSKTSKTNHKGTLITFWPPSTNPHNKDFKL